MIQKPKIQYVGQFYVYGSEAQKLETGKQRRKARTRLPLARLEQVDKVCLDPVALTAIVVAVVMLVVMGIGLVQLYYDWTEYQAMSTYVSKLNQENAVLTREYREGYDLEEIRTKAEGLGLVPESQVPVMVIQVTVPQPAPEPTWLDNLMAFFQGLFA